MRWGVMAEVACQLTERCFDCLLSPVRRIGFPDIPIPCGFEQEQLLLPNAATIARAAAHLLAAGPAPQAARGDKSPPGLWAD